jgi:hypothetical protein
MFSEAKAWYGMRRFRLRRLEELEAGRSNEFWRKLLEE